jgi:predicted transcriptional regulator
MKEFNIGTGQMKVMKVLWKKKKATAQEILAELNAEEPTKRSTVQTFLRLLAGKKVIGYETENRTRIYFPLVEEREVKRHALDDVVEHVFDGSTHDLMLYLFGSDYISDSEIDKVREMLDDNEE